MIARNRYQRFAAACRRWLSDSKALVAVGLLALSFSASLPAAIEVCSAEALKQAATNARPGAEIVMCSKTWSDVAIAFVANGTAAAPIRVVAAEPGKVVLTGSSTMYIGGNYVEVDGIKFEGSLRATVAFRFKALDRPCN